MAFEKASDKKGGAETAQLRVLPFEAVLRHRCDDCGLEREEYAGRLVSEGRLGQMTPIERAKMLKCARSACGGNLTVTVDTQG